MTKTTHRIMKRLQALLFAGVVSLQAYSQSNPATDSLVQLIIDEPVSTEGGTEAGVQLIQKGNYGEATKFFSAEIGKDESDRRAFFRRGVANFAMSDTLAACRDWSAVLALGDTAMFNLLDSKCHGAMIIEEDTIPSKQYRKMWAKTPTASPQESARTVVDEMPSFPGGEIKLVEYLRTNMHKPEGSPHGTVYVNFLISPKGKIVYPYVTRGINSECDKEAMRLVKNMPPWNPGKEKGKAVFVRNNIPVRF